MTKTRKSGKTHQYVNYSTVFSVCRNYARWPRNSGSLFADGQTTEVLESIGPEIAEIRRPCRKLCSGQKDGVTNPRRLVYRI